MKVAQKNTNIEEKFSKSLFLEVPGVNYLKLVDEIVENSLDSVIAIDSNGIICAWNLQAEATFGWKRFDVVGEPLINTIIPESYRQAHLDGVKEFFLTGEGAALNRRLEVRAVNRQGIELPVELYVMPVRFGESVRFYAFIRDISEAKLREMELKKLNAELALSLRQRDEFLSIASHELKTPLTSLRLQVQMMERELRKANAQSLGQQGLERAMAMCYKQIDSLSHIVGDLLDISRVQAGRLAFNFTELDMAELISDTVEKFSEEVKRAGCTLDLKLEPKVFGIWDQGRMEQVITNLLSNALKYAANSEIVISLAPSDVEGHIKISVSDSGLGVDPKNLSAVFEPFFRADGRHQYGQGLGLHISRRIVEGHGGRIWAENKLSGGARFDVELPIHSTEKSSNWRTENV